VAIKELALVNKPIMELAKSEIIVIFLTPFASSVLANIPFELFAHHILFEILNQRIPLQVLCSFVG